MSFALRSAAAAACLFAAAMNLDIQANARETSAGSGECHHFPPGDRGMPPGGHDGMAGGPWGPRPAAFGSTPLPPWMHQLQLSESQQDRVFTILHEQEPGLRDRFKAVHHSREALHRASLSPGADAAQLRSLADAAGKADADLAVLMAQTDQQLLLVLTPEQTALLQDCLNK